MEVRGTCNKSRQGGVGTLEDLRVGRWDSLFEVEVFLAHLLQSRVVTGQTRSQVGVVVPVSTTSSTLPVRRTVYGTDLVVERFHRSTTPVMGSP